MERKKQNKEEQRSKFSFIHIFEFIERNFFAMGMIVTFIMTLFISISAFFRWALRMPVPGGYEITQDYLMPIVFFLCVSAVYDMGGHIRVTLLLKHLPVSLGRLIRLVTDVLCFLLSVLMTYAATLNTINAIQSGEFSSSVLQYPLAPAYALAVLGFGMLSIRMIIQILSQCKES